MTICQILDVPGGNSMVGIMVNEIPLGVKNCVNNSFRTMYPYISGTLEPYVDGIKIDPSSYTEHIDLQGFTFLIDPTDSKKLNRPLMNTESLYVNYLRSSSGQNCITTL